MPTAKRQKKGGESQAAPSTRSKTKGTGDRPTVADIEGESTFAQLAKKTWLKPTKRTTKVKVKNDVLKQEIWDVLERDGFPYKSILTLESLQTLERFVCPLEVLRFLLTWTCPVIFGLDTQTNLPTIMSC